MIVETIIASVGNNSGGLDNWYEIAGIIIALPVALALIWGIIKIVRHFDLVHEVIVGRPATPMSEKIPSVIERFQTQDLRMVELHKCMDKNTALTKETAVKVEDLSEVIAVHVEEDAKSLEIIYEALENATAQRTIAATKAADAVEDARTEVKAQTTERARVKNKP